MLGLALEYNVNNLGDLKLQVLVLILIQIQTNEDLQVIKWD